MSEISQLKKIEIFKDLNDEELSALADICTPILLAKKEKLAEPDRTFNQIFLIKNGLIRWYNFDELGNEFSPFLPSERENVLMTTPEVYLGGDRSKYIIEAVVDTELLLFDFKKFEEVCERFPKIQKIYLESLKNIAAAMVSRIEQLCTKAPEERYEDFLSERPFTSQNASRKYIANFLGITANSLSRLTARIQKNRKFKKN
ncbi:Crp/Fnr family transcriptional regulator [Soonwooa sp.]|uniref:Crp/Fnr family transcriptional regulator n=1 Tax=Soonwooa sp. TaxID=1938592 RepID=UPI00260549E9|nr:Crp/Fnr family transcriptional regulator [Soonwooa sp.]